MIAWAESDEEDFKALFKRIKIEYKSVQRQLRRFISHSI